MKDTWSLLENDFRTVERTLLELLERTQAQAAHLVDRGGRIVMSVGPDVEYDLNSFASLAAADLAANDELMRLFGGPRVDGVVCLGTFRSMASTLVADRLALCVVFDRRTTLGLVRHRMRRAVEKLTPVFNTLFARRGVAGEGAPAAAGQPAAGPRAEPDIMALPVPANFAAAAGAALDDLLGEDVN
jgi:predicted regulator of Ras-like GTPase activity (Roadblock/LC7/MglB family)